MTKIMAKRWTLIFMIAFLFQKIKSDVILSFPMEWSQSVMNHTKKKHIFSENQKPF